VRAAHSTAHSVLSSPAAQVHPCADRVRAL